MGQAVPLDVTRLGRYQILQHLATGGMAEVLIAKSQGPFGTDHVVIKRIRRDQASDPQFVKMFIDEATLAAGLDHPNVVKVHEIGQEGGEYFFAMEYVHGEDLRRVLVEVNRRRDKVPIALVTGIVAAAAAGLEHAHRQIDANGAPLGIVHRDVSPANILVGYDGRVKVADFGIAKAALRTVETRSGTLKGKVSYMSPEQVTGRPVDRRSDVFALGIVLYEVATARRLFRGENDFLTMSAIVQGDIPLPSVHRPDLPRILEDIIMKALAPAPERRFQSAEELRAELEKFTHAIGMRMSNESIADYMRTLFGERAEPWLVPEFEPTQTTTLDFDGSASGLVRPPEESVHRLRVPMSPGARPEPSSPIMMSRDAVTPPPRAPSIAPGVGTEDPAAAWITKPPTGTGSGQPLAWSVQQPPPARRRFGIVLGMTAVAVIAGVAIMMRGGGDGDGDVADHEPVAKTETAGLANAAAVSTTDETPAREAAAATIEPAAANPTPTATAPTDPVDVDPATRAKADAASKAQIAAQAALEAKTAKDEAARIAKEAADAKAEIAAKAALEAKAAKAEAARIAKEEKATRDAERVQAAKLAKAEKAKIDAAKAKTEKTKARPTTTKPGTGTPKPGTGTPKPGTGTPKPETKWDPNSLFPQ